MDAGFVTSSKLLSQVVSILEEKCKFPSRNILFLGYGQGGMAALSYLTSSLPNPNSSSGPSQEKEFGGVISIGAGLPASFVLEGKGKARTPVLVCGGSRSTQVTRGAVDKLRGAFTEVEYVKWQKADDGMMRNREEALPVMRFFGRRLRSRAGVPEGSLEVG